MNINPFHTARALAGRAASTSAISACLLLSTSLSAAQPAPDAPPAAEKPPDNAPAADTGAAAPSPGVDTSAAGAQTPDAAATPDAATPLQEPAAAGDQTTTGPKLNAQGTATADVGTEFDHPIPAQSKPLPVALELLPPSAYPSDPLPGIPGGSLAFVLDRLQWPYMPKYAGDEPALRVGFSGVSWIDSNLRQIRAGLSTEDDQTEYPMQGRLTLRVTPTYNRDDDWFLQSNIEFVANVDQDRNVTNYVDIDDAWIRLGKWKMFDIQVGRMQGFEVYHFGMGMDLNTYEREGAASFSNTPVQPYGLTDLWDRGISNGAIAFHWYLPKFLRLELLTRFGVSGQGNDVGVRPVGVLDLGWLKAKAGYERRLRASIFDNSDARIEMQGLAGELQFVLTPWVEFGGGVGRRVEDAFEQDGAVRAAASHTTVTAGGFLNVRPYFENWLVGVGYHHTAWENFNFDAFFEPENQTHEQMFGAVQYLLWDRLYIKYVLSYANAHIELRNDTDVNDTGFVNEMLSHRLRLMLVF